MSVFVHVCVCVLLVCVLKSKTYVVIHYEHLDKQFPSYSRIFYLTKTRRYDRVRLKATVSLTSLPIISSSDAACMSVTTVMSGALLP